MQLVWHRIKNWEYWSMYIIYMPTFFIWIWYMFKFRSFHFYRLINPALPNGGLIQDSKWIIYHLLPKGTYPTTLFVKKTEPLISEELLAKAGLHFPVIVKPDIGLRGIGVEQLFSYQELYKYYTSSKTDFLIQDMIQYPNEIGLFYCRFPNMEHGFITGITIKEFLTIKGNGQETIVELLRKNKRYAQQIKPLSQKMNLLSIPKTGEEICLVPFGNHNRGTAFYDGSMLITPKLQNTFNRILAQIDGFYYGRLDIRYNSFEELEDGIKFSIIELNGAKSEPTHIYDPKISFIKGQQEILRHQRLIGKIVKSNKKN